MSVEFYLWVLYFTIKYSVQLFTKYSLVFAKKYCARYTILKLCLHVIIVYHHFRINLVEFDEK